jgi:hypothetical protein
MPKQQIDRVTAVDGLAREIRKARCTCHHEGERPEIRLSIRWQLMVWHFAPHSTQPCFCASTLPAWYWRRLYSGFCEQCPKLPLHIIGQAVTGV